MWLCTPSRTTTQRDGVVVYGDVLWDGSGSDVCLCIRVMCCGNGCVWCVVMICVRDECVCGYVGSSTSDTVCGGCGCG